MVIAKYTVTFNKLIVSKQIEDLFSLPYKFSHTKDIVINHVGGESDCDISIEIHETSRMEFFPARNEPHIDYEKFLQLIINAKDSRMVCLR